MVRATEPVPRATPTPVAQTALPLMLPSSTDMSRLMQARVGIRPSQGVVAPMTEALRYQIRKWQL